ncbi:hypothetical protein AXG93_2777s1000 [Marchantia polymorpha subsp. ruderalis]|uniref:Integrase catalytic domain-containing protein n=1 Tax=Marchantia polymorpha subsp. ruderalis TaxID=1480154 RepID=A0A176VPS1_MARPO|nr:hypothetical protein AXG93_2777s1000 [Marchantia polymorpha subsp. ruderalis]
MLEVNLAESSSNEWFIDSGASKHVTGQKSLLSDLDSNCRSKISTTGGHTLNVAGKGSVKVPTPSGGIRIDNVLYVPGLPTPATRGKQSRSPKPRILPPRPAGLVRKVATRAQQPLELLHTDICGPLSSKSLSGSRYILTITDDFSRFSWLYFLKKKSETLVKFKQFKSMIELQTSHRIKAIRSDNGEEYISQDFIRFCDESGIIRQLTQTYTPHQNGVAEQKNRTLLDKARCMAFASGIPNHLWTEAVATANYVTNRTSTKANNGVTPFERLTGKLPLYVYRRREPPPSSSSIDVPSSDPFVITTRSGRASRPPARLSDFHLNILESPELTCLPASVEAALLYPGWKTAMEAELEPIYENDTWSLVPLPPDQKVICTKWVFRVKTNADGTTAKLKARLVTRGFQQQASQDYNETFAPVVKWNTLRSVVALAGHQGWSIYHLDVKTAFLNGVITEYIYVSPPPGFSNSPPTHACKLRKALYGLKQAPRA